MKEIVFQVEEGEVDGGWVAAALGVGITTQAETLDGLKEMIRDALRRHFDREEDIPPVIRLHSPLKLGTLRAILANLETHHRMSRSELLDTLDL